MKELLERVLKRVKPTDEEERRISKAKERLLSTIMSLKKEYSFEEAVFVGSTARDTHLRGASDIDLFLIYPRSVPTEKIEKEVLDMAKRLGGELNYAQHPYFKLSVDGIDAEIVPAYRTRPGERVLSATDRTPLHNEYVKAHLREWQKDEVRLLKAFMKGIGVYGAEIKVEGFSGYLCELLIIHYGDFLSTLRAATKWKWGEIIDIEGQGAPREKRPLIVVDPVDPNRNVAHTVSKRSMALFIIAAREFLRNPSLKFFFPRKPKLPPSKIKRLMDRRGSQIVAVVLRYPEGEAPDNTWGQLKKLGRKIAKKLRQKDNFVLQHGVWTDEKSFVFVLLEIVGRYTARIHKREGPPVTDEINTSNFLDKHVSDPFGPYIEDGRLISFYEVEEKGLLVEVFESVEEVAEERSVGGGLGEEIRRWVDVVEGRGILKYFKVEGFQEFFSDFLLRKFPWEY